MAKTKRGKKIKNIPNWRGSCPICKRTDAKFCCKKGAEYNYD